MELVEAKYQDEYSIKYIVYESKCPKCGALEEHHLEAEAKFFKKQMKCYKCEHVFMCESE